MTESVVVEKEEDVFVTFMCAALMNGYVISRRWTVNYCVFL
jgi:hypothetical protein